MEVNNKTIGLEVMLDMCPVSTANREAVTSTPPDVQRYPAGSRRAVSVGGGKGSNSGPPMLTVFLCSIKSKLIKLFCRAVSLLLFCSWSKVTKQLLFCPQGRWCLEGERSSHLLRPLGVSPRALQGCTSLTCSKGGGETQQQQHQVQTHRGDWAEPLYSAPAAL